MKKLNIVFFGTPDFSVPALDILYNHPLVNLKYVISMPDRKAGRGHKLTSPEVIEFAKDKKIPTFQTTNINKEEEFLNSLHKQSIDCFIVLAFAQFLNQNLLSIPKIGAFNIHTSLLPKYRGAAPIQYALLNADSHTGVSIQKMVKKMDAGDIAHFNEVQIYPGETGGQLYTRLKFQAALCLNEFVYMLYEDKITYISQDENHVSFAPTLKREDGFIDFKTMKTQKIVNMSCALFPWPGTFCFLDSKRLKILSVTPSTHPLEAGMVSTKDGQLIIGTIDGALRINQLQLEGKKACSDIELLNGHKERIIINPN